VNKFWKGFEKKAVRNPELRKIIRKALFDMRKLKKGFSSKSAFKNTMAGKALSRIWQ